MKKTLKKLVLTLLLVSLILPGLSVRAAHGDKTHHKPTGNIFKEQERLWIDHVSWTRSYIISAIAGLKDQDDVLQRLLKNQEDIGNSIKPFYGEEAGKKLTNLLKEHISLAGKVLKAAKANDKQELDKYNKLWYENADKIAEFLSATNPNYSQKKLKNMLYTHLKLLTDQVVARLGNDWKADINAFDKGETNMIHFADILAAGIMKQLHDKCR